MPNKQKTVAVAMSGGIDSAMAAYNLKQQGYKVLGVFMDLGIDQREAKKTAQKNCQKMNIQFHSFDLSGVFKKEVIEYLLDSYKKGYTPNPCIKCNKLIKFNELLNFSIKLEADHLATGHYCKKIIRRTGSTPIYELYEANDKSKDQSYFLYTLTQKQLKSILFPLGEYQKEEAKKAIIKAGLSFAGTESQDICFISSSLEQFLKQNLDLKEGPVLSLEGEKLGNHEGLPLFTLGQRKGINIGGNGPYYVAGFDHERNILYVTNKKDNPTLYYRELKVIDINWISGREPENKQKLQAKTRYSQAKKECSLKKSDSDYRVIFKEELRTITPGQSVVFYKGEQLLGGGIIYQVL